MYNSQHDEFIFLANLKVSFCEPFITTIKETEKEKGKLQYKR